MRSTNKKNIKFGSKDLLENDEFDPKYGKERITLFLDQQVVDAFRLKAEKTGDKYQALIRDVLKKHIFESERPDIENRLKKIEKELKLLKKA